MFVYNIQDIWERTVPQLKPDTGQWVFFFFFFFLTPGVALHSVVDETIHPLVQKVGNITRSEAVSEFRALMFIVGEASCMQLIVEYTHWGVSVVAVQEKCWALAANRIVEGRRRRIYLILNRKRLKWYSACILRMKSWVQTHKKRKENRRRGEKNETLNWISSKAGVERTSDPFSDHFLVLSLRDRKRWIKFSYWNF